MAPDFLPGDRPDDPRMDDDPPEDDEQEDDDGACGETLAERNPSLK